MVSNHVEKEWGWVEPTLFTSKHIQKKWGGVEPTLFMLKPVPSYNSTEGGVVVGAKLSNKHSLAF